MFPRLDLRGNGSFTTCMTMNRFVLDLFFLVYLFLLTSFAIYAPSTSQSSVISMCLNTDSDIVNRCYMSPGDFDKFLKSSRAWKMPTSVF